MRKHRTVGLDTPILIYHFEDVAPYSDLTERLIAAAGRGEVELLVPALCITEFLVKPWERGEKEAEKPFPSFWGSRTRGSSPWGSRSRRKRRD